MKTKIMERSLQSLIIGILLWWRMKKLADGEVEKV